MSAWVWAAFFLGAATACYVIAFLDWRQKRKSKTTKEKATCGCERMQMPDGGTLTKMCEKHKRNSLLEYEIARKGTRG